MGITLKTARTNKKMRQIDAAKALGVSVYTIQNYEPGKTYPDVHMLKKIEKLYGFPYSEIIFLPKYYT
ncbi:helix-turn-helix transcriptional regulator [Megasphaera paucivorans]|uniref:Helix-turn-helix domain-containing protein n=1 Tax=Megasphaera paucivorans TaxID=349095 RepID=A0A1G9QIF5_9FIRM|nr:helix-turn-helix transcriptional regulator [Megasphaera paucivorans]SDM10095.1 Helix-turn-helix domain-containing protein [Megasphaera paucivorans]